MAVEEILADVPRPTTGGGTWGGRSPRSTGRSVSLPSTEALRPAAGEDRGLGRTARAERRFRAREVLRVVLGTAPITPISDERRRAYAFRAPIALNRLIPGVIS